MNRLEGLKNDLETCNNWTSKNWSGLPKEVQMMIARGITRTEDYIEYEERKLSKVAGKSWGENNES
jgi:hypothetical protein